MKLITGSIIFLFVATTFTTARRCYVCGPTADEPFKNSLYHNIEDDIDSNEDDIGHSSSHRHNNNNNKKNENSKKNFTILEKEQHRGHHALIPDVSVLHCDEFEKSNNLEIYSFECPLNYVGCITQIDGNEIIRTCDSLPINDCQTANGVEYCYCNTDLCNAKYTPPKIIERHHRKTFTPTSDDEDDFLEASGMRETTILDRNHHRGDILFTSSDSTENFLTNGPNILLTTISSKNTFTSSSSSSSSSSTSKSSSTTKTSTTYSSSTNSIYLNYKLITTSSFIIGFIILSTNLVI